MNERKIKRQKGAYLVFTLVTLGVLLAFAALMVDIGRVSISSLQQKQLTDAAATLAIQSWVAPNKSASETIDLTGTVTTEAQYNARLNYVKDSVVFLLNDSLNSLFGNPGEDIVSINSTDDSGLMLTAGTYIPDVSTCTSADCVTCRSKNPTANRNGCFLESYWSADRSRIGVNAFSAKVSMRAAAPIQYYFAKLIPTGGSILPGGGGPSSSAGFSSESFAFQRPRNFIALVDMSPSITGGNFNDEGRQRARFVYKFAEGGGGGNGSSCYGTDTSADCNMNRSNGDDFAWNSQLYFNLYTTETGGVSDGRCDTAGFCEYNNGEYGDMWVLHHDDTTIRSRWTLYSQAAKKNLPTNTAPLFATVSGNGVNTPATCNGRQYCDTPEWFRSTQGIHYWRFLGDDRSAAMPFPTVLDKRSGLTDLVRQPFVRRFKSDYKNISVDNVKRAKLAFSTGQFSESTNPLETYQGNYLVEDPNPLSEDQRYHKNPIGNDDTPSFYEFPTNALDHILNQPPKTVDGVACHWGGNTSYANNGNSSGNVDIYNSLLGMYAPEVERNYTGPEPYNSILKGLYRIHDSIQDQNIPGDKLMILPFDDTIGSIDATVPLTDVIRYGEEDGELSESQLKLKTVLDSIKTPTLVHPNITTKFHSWDQIQKRIKLGLIPDSSKRNTNISRAIATTIAYASKAGIQGADNYLLLFSDFVATGTCSLSQLTLTQPVTDAQLQNCIESTDSIGGVSWVSQPGDLEDPGVSIDREPFLASGANPNVPQNRAWRALQDLRIKRNGNDYGLLKRLREMGITPIFFAFNGKDGGKPVFQDNNNSAQCLSDDGVKGFGDRIASGISTGRWGLKWSYATRPQHRRPDRFYFEIGSLASSVSSIAGGKYVRLLPGCPCFGSGCGSTTNPNPSATAAMNRLCSSGIGGVNTGGVPKMLEPTSWRGNIGLNTSFYQNSTFSVYDDLNRTNGDGALGITQGFYYGAAHDSGGSFLFSLRDENGFAGRSDIYSKSCANMLNTRNNSITEPFAGMGQPLGEENLAPFRANTFILSDTMASNFTAWGTARCEPGKTGKDMSDKIFTEIEPIFLKSTASIISPPQYYVPKP